MRKQKSSNYGPFPFDSRAFFTLSPGAYFLKAYLLKRNINCPLLGLLFVDQVSRIETEKLLSFFDLYLKFLIGVSWQLVPIKNHRVHKHKLIACVLTYCVPVS